MSNSQAESGKPTTSNLKEGTNELLQKLQAINEQVRDFDPALKARAVELLLAKEFEGATGFAVGSKTVSATEGTSSAPTGAPFTSLVEKWRPATQSEWALLAAYHRAVNEGEENVSGQSINSMLKHHGVGIKNITRALGDLVNASPALMLQVKKAGTTKQARKTFRMTTLGRRFVEGKFAGSLEVN
jgi:hypothetical protein